MQFLQRGEKGCRLPGGIGDDDENASSCNDGDCIGDGLLGEGEQRPDVSSDRKTGTAADASGDAA